MNHTKFDEELERILSNAREYGNSTRETKAAIRALIGRGIRGDMDVHSPVRTYPIGAGPDFAEQNVRLRINAEKQRLRELFGVKEKP